VFLLLKFVFRHVPSSPFVSPFSSPFRVLVMSNIVTVPQLTVGIDEDVWVNKVNGSSKIQIF